MVERLSAGGGGEGDGFVGGRRSARAAAEVLDWERGGLLGGDLGREEGRGWDGGRGVKRWEEGKGKGLGLGWVVVALGGGWCDGGEWIGRENGWIGGGEGGKGRVLWRAGRREKWC